MITEDLVKNIVETRFEVFPKERVESAKNEIIDAIGCAIGGAHASGCDMLVDLVREWGGKEESTILVHGVQAPSHNVVLVNCVMARSFDFEPTARGAIQPCPMHLGGTTVPTALAAAEQKGASGRELLTALILGDDLATRIGGASSWSFPRDGFDGIGLFNTFGAAAIAGKLLGLNERQMLNAFGIVVNQLAATVQSLFDGVHTFKLINGLSARAGVFSVELAKKGLTGIKDPLLSDYGYFNLYCRNPKPEILTHELGKKFYPEEYGIKRYSCCFGNHLTLDATLELVHKNDIKPEDVQEIILDKSPSDFLDLPFEIREDTQMHALFNISYNVANALVRRSVRPEHFTEEYIRDPKVVETVKKIHLITTLPIGRETRPGVNIKIKMKDGREFSIHKETPSRLGTREEIIEKFRGNVAYSKTVPKENAETALSMLERLEEIGDVTQIIKLLIA